MLMLNCSVHFHSDDMNIRINNKGVTIVLTDDEFNDIDSAVVCIAHDGAPVSEEFKKRLGEKYVPKFTETFNKLIKRR